MPNNSEKPQKISMMNYVIDLEHELKEFRSKLASQCGKTMIAMDALRELVACKDLKESIPMTHTVERQQLHDAYERRKPLAWNAARDVLAKLDTGTETASEAAA